MTLEAQNVQPDAATVTPALVAADSPTTISTPPIVSPPIQTPVIGPQNHIQPATLAATTDQPRTAVKAPENASVQLEAVMPPESPVTTIPLPSPAPQGEAQGIAEQAIAQPTSLVVTAAQIKKAEENVAAFIGAKIDPALTDGLMLTLSSNAVNGATDVKLSFEGKQLAANADLFDKQVLAALQTVASIAPYFHHTRKPHAQPAKEANRTNVRDIHIPQLTTAQYASLIQALATGIIQQTPHLFTSQQSAVASAVSAPLMEQADVTASTAAAPQDQREAVSEPAPSLSLVPESKVVAPVEHRGVAVNDPIHAISA